MKTIGEIIRDRRESRGISRENLAKKLKINSKYLGQIECTDRVQISERLVEEFQMRLGLNRISKAVVTHNEMVKRYRNKLKKSA